MDKKLKSLSRIRYLLPALLFMLLQATPSIAQYPGEQMAIASFPPGAPLSPQAPIQIEMLDQLGGSSYAVTLSGNFAYLGIGPRMVILDISDPTHPVEVGKSAALPGIVLDIAIWGNYACVANGRGGMRIIDVSDPYFPVEIGSYLASEAWHVTVASNYAYLTDNFTGLHIIDISQPATPEWVSTFSMGNWVIDVAVSGNYAYVTQGAYGLRIIDITDPSAPVEAGFLDTPGQAFGIVVDQSYAYLADSDGLRIFSTTNPTAPEEKGFIQTPDLAFGVAVSNGIACVTSYASGLRIIKVMDPASPTEIGYYDTPGFALGIDYKENFAYVADRHGGLRIINVQDSRRPMEVSYYSTTGNNLGMAVSGDYIYTVDFNTGLHIIDISNPATLAEVGTYLFYGNFIDVAVYGNYAYLSERQFRMSIIDVTVPANPEFVGFYTSPGYINGVDVTGGTAYVASDIVGLRIVDVSTPNAPVEIGSLDTPGSALDVTVAGDFAYIADGSGGLRIVNISDPTQPVEVGSYTTSANMISVAISGDYAYLAADISGLLIIDITDKSKPVLAGSIDTPGNASNVAISGRHAFVADSASGLRIIDISNPSAPLEDNFYHTPGNTQSVAIAGNSVYLADSDGGVVSLRACLVPGKPALVSPEDSKVTNDGTPLFKWDAAPDASHYRFEVAYDAGFENTAILKIIDSTIFTPATNLLADEYFWRVESLNLTGGCGTPGVFSEQWAFTIVPLPGAFNKLTPPDGQTKIPIDQELLLSWQSSPGAANYEYCLDTTNDDACSTGWFGAALDTSKNIGNLKKATTYYWQVRSLNADVFVYANNAAWWKFTTVVPPIFLPFVTRNYRSFFEGPGEIEPNNSRSAANGPIRSGRIYTGLLDDNNDYFSFETSTPGAISISLSHKGSGAQLLLYDAAGTLVGIASGASPLQINYSSGAAGKYFLRIYTDNPLAAYYTFFVNYPYTNP